MSVNKHRAVVGWMAVFKEASQKLKTINTKLLPSRHDINNNLEKSIKYIAESLRYTYEFCLGKGYMKFNCWGCKNDINLTKRIKFVKCQKCWCWNIHPVWSKEGENFESFSRKLSTTGLIFLLVAALLVLGVYWLSLLLY